MSGRNQRRIGRGDRRPRADIGRGAEGRRTMPGHGIGVARLAAILAGGLFLFLAVGSCTLVGVPPRVEGPATGSPDRPEPGDPSPSRRAGEESYAQNRGADEVRALWVVRTALSHPDSARAMVDRADRAGFNTLLVQVRGRGDAFYRSRREPRAEALRDAPPDYDPLGLVLEEAHRRGIAVHAWVNVHLVHGMGDLPTSPRHLVRSDPQLLAVPRDLASELSRTDPYDPAYVQTLLEWARRNRDRIEGLYTSPSSPAVKRHVEGVLRDLVDRYPLDGVHLDYLRYPSPEFDYSPEALAAFRGWAGSRIAPSLLRELASRSETDARAFPDALPELWARFRREQVTDLMRRAERTVRAARPGIVLSAAVRADPVDARDQRFQDWPAWLEEGSVDAVAPMAYTEDDELFRSWVHDAVGWAGKDRVWAGIGVYKTTLRGTLEQIRIARSTGAAGVALFSYDWAVGEDSAGGRGGSFLDRVGAAAFDAPVGLD